MYFEEINIFFPDPTSICSMRLDFETFTTVGPASNTDTAAVNNCVDSLTITATPAIPGIPIICGENAGQHSSK